MASSADNVMGALGNIPAFDFAEWDHVWREDWGLIAERQRASQDEIDQARANQQLAKEAWSQTYYKRHVIVDDEAASAISEQREKNDARRQDDAREFFHALDLERERRYSIALKTNKPLSPTYPSLSDFLALTDPPYLPKPSEQPTEASKTVKKVAFDVSEDEDEVTSTIISDEFEPSASIYPSSQPHAGPPESALFSVSEPRAHLALSDQDLSSAIHTLKHFLKVWCDTYFTYISSPSLRNNHNNQEEAIDLQQLAAMSPELITYIGYIASGNPNWDSLFNVPNQRAALVYGILGKVLEVWVFGSLLFGATPSQTRELEAFEKRNANIDGSYPFIYSLPNRTPHTSSLDTNPFSHLRFRTHHPPLQNHKIFPSNQQRTPSLLNLNSRTNIPHLHHAPTPPRTQQPSIIIVSLPSIFHLPNNSPRNPHFPAPPNLNPRRAYIHLPPPLTNNLPPNLRLQSHALRFQNNERT